MDPSLNGFVVEAQNILEDLEKSLFCLQDLHPDDYRKPDVINSLFRHAHSLKGLSGMFNLQRISGLSHRIETFLNGVRLGRIPFSGEVLDLLGQGRQILHEMVWSVSEGAGEGSSDHGSFLHDLESLERKDKSWSGEDLSSHIELSKDLMETLSEYEEHRFWDNIRKGTSFFKVCCSLPLETFDGELRQLGSSIREIGELLTTMPQSSLMEKGHIGFSLYFTSRKEPEQVREKLGVHEGGLKMIPYREGPLLDGV